MTTLKGYDKGWDVDHAFVTGHLDALLRQQVEGTILDAFMEHVDVDDPRPFKHVIKAIDVAKLGEQARALDMTYTKTLISVSTMLHQLHSNVSPEDRDIAKMSSFHKAVLKCCEQRVPPCYAPKDPHNTKPRCGREAILALYDTAAL